MNKQFLKDAVGWGFGLWLIGYTLGILLFALVPVNVIGWIIMPIATVITLWVAFKKVKSETLQSYSAMAFIWLLIAAAGDYLFIVKALKPADGYYKPDVYLYYALTLVIPIFAGWKKQARPAVASRAVHSMR